MESLVVPNAGALWRGALLAASLAACGNEPAAAAPPSALGDAMAPADANIRGDGDDGMVVSGEPATFLPLEVLGSPGTEMFAIIVLDAAEVATTIAVDLSIHNIVEPNSAELRINGKTIIDLSAREGPFISPVGDVRSARVAIDASALRVGANSFVFRYTRQVQDLAAVSGFRVLALSVIAGEAPIRPSLRLDSPATWTPIRADPASIERGRVFFQETSRDGGPTCARCHADSGADLQYYAFSNRSISRRAMFHKFAEDEADDIASYIRALPVVAVGRPYDPPFQPGPSNHGAAGAGYDAVLADEDTFALSVFGSEDPAANLPWNFADGTDTFRLPTRAVAPTWMRWLPRDLPEEWFTRLGGTLARAEQLLATTPTLASAQTFMSAALAVARDVLVESGDYDAKINVLRFAAVKLWDWSRKNGFHRSDHGVPDSSPAYAYEVGFAFFEAAQAGTTSIPDAFAQTTSWWWAQLATYPGRGFSNGKRPLNFQDVLMAADSANLGPAHLAFLHLYGSWEESRGTLVPPWGTGEGPVRLLATPMRRLSAAGRVAMMRRFLAKESEHLSTGGVLGEDHHTALAQAWSAGCETLSIDQRAALRGAAPSAVARDLQACP